MFLALLYDALLGGNKAPIDKFGIVAAMSRNNVIGVDGKIPWKLPEDRTLFKSLTANRIMIIGKRTFKEHPMLAHINHTRACIVVSRTLESIESNPGNAPGTRIVLARSFTEALVTAKDLENELVGASNAPDGVGCPGINCWIAGGERLYKEALLHDSAAEVHVSVIDLEIDDNSTGHVARFPFQTLCGNSFEGSTAISYPGHGESPSFTYHIYKKVIPT